MQVSLSHHPEGARWRHAHVVTHALSFVLFVSLFSSGDVGLVISPRRRCIATPMPARHDVEREDWHIGVPPDVSPSAILQGQGSSESRGGEPLHSSVLLLSSWIDVAEMAYSYLNAEPGALSLRGEERWHRRTRERR